MSSVANEAPSFKSVNLVNIYTNERLAISDNSTYQIDYPNEYTVLFDISGDSSNKVSISHEYNNESREFDARAGKINSLSNYKKRTNQFDKSDLSAGEHRFCITSTGECRNLTIHSNATNAQLRPSQTLQAQDKIKNTDVKLVMQDDGNFVVYDRDSKKALWASGTNGHSGARAVMQNDGNLVVYGAGGNALWASNSNLSGSRATGRYLSLESDQLVIREASGARVKTIAQY